MRPKTVLAIAAASALLAVGTASAQDRQPAPEKSRSAQKAGKDDAGRDAKRMKDLAAANMAEVETGKLALEKAQDPKVKEFAQHMVDDHSKMLEELKSLAEAKSVQLPSAPDAKHQKVMKKLQSASGDDFDREYMRAMVKDHRDALKLAQRTAKGAKDEQLKASAQKAAPEIQEHLKMARDISKSEKHSGTGRSSRSQRAYPVGAAR